MIKVYIMETCPDCVQVKSQLKDNPNYELIDIGMHVRNLKQFIRLRDTHPAFAHIKVQGTIGIPCFVFEDGNIQFSTEEVITEMPIDGEACSLDGSGC